MEDRSMAQSLIKAAAPLLTAWFAENKRYMPWREDPTPYHVWVSEIMLQQTRVDTVMPYYGRFIEALPDVKALAACEEDRLLKLFEGLGYYSRVKNMQKAAVKLAAENDGVMPATFDELRALPGIGDYTAGAISSIAGHQPEPVVDGNVLRVVSRLLGAYDDIGQQKTKVLYADLLKEFLLEGSEDPSTFNQGLMELGALVCVPNGAPKCEVCPWNEICLAYLQGLTDEIPVKQARKARKIAHKTVLILRRGNTCGIVKREEEGLLSGLYGFPMTEGALSEAEVREEVGKMGLEAERIVPLKPGKHVFSHVEWHMQAYEVTVAESMISTNDCAEKEADLSEGLKKAAQNEQRPALIFVGKEELETGYALPAAFRKWTVF